MAFNVGTAPVGVLARALTGNIFVEQSLAYMNEGDKDGSSFRSTSYFRRIILRYSC